MKYMLNKVKLNKAPGEDRVPYEFIINASNEFYARLLQMFSEDRIDDSFSKTIIFPIYKKGDPGQPRNYRGIWFMLQIF